MGLNCTFYSFVYIRYHLNRTWKIQLTIPIIIGICDEMQSELYSDNPDDPDAEQRHHTYEASDECNCGYDVIVTATGIENPAGAKIKEWEFDFEGCKKSE